jgi:hypothetical protein
MAKHFQINIAEDRGIVGLGPRRSAPARRDRPSQQAFEFLLLRHKALRWRYRHRRPLAGPPYQLRRDGL